MATYYVRTDGDNGNVGTSYTTGGAWATVAYAVSQVAAGDTVRIAPGTYYETITLATDGGSGTEIIWWGDKEAQYFLDLKPGYVRITGCNSGTGIGEGTVIIEINSKAYNYFYNLVIDGTASNASAVGVQNTNETKFYDCIIYGSAFAVYGGSTCSIYRCVLVSAQCCTYYTNSYDCFFMGGSTGQYGGNAYNCVGINSYTSFYYAYAYNCVAIANYYGYFLNYYCENCQALYCYVPFYYSTKIVKCKTLGCYYSFVANANANDLKYTLAAAVSAVGETHAMHEGYTDVSKLLKIATALKFDIFEQGWSTDLHEYTVAGATEPTTANNDYVTIGTYNSNNLYQSIYKDTLIFNSTTLSPGNWVIQTNATTSPDELATDYAYCATLIGTYTNVGTFAGTITCAAYTPITFTEDYDILRHPRRMGDGILDCGAFEHSDVDMEWTTYKTVAPAVKISRKGQKRLTIAVKGGVAKTISSWVYFSGSTTPQMVLSSSEDVLVSSTGYTVTAVGAEETWEQLSFTTIPKASGLLFIDLYARDTGIPCYSIFSDFII